MAPGVLQVVGNGKTAIPVPDSEILKLQMAVASEAPRQPWPYIALGQRVRVTYGSLSGLEGILINFKGSHRVVLSVTLLQRSVAIEVEQSWIAALEPSRNPSTTKDFAERSTRIPANSY
jgi:transcription antitermination factor NusG